MSLGSIVASNISLDACYGDAASSVWPSTLWLHLFVSDPTAGGAELTSAGGYAPISIANNSTNWPDASGGQKTNGALFAYPASTGPWSGPADFWWLSDAPAALPAPGAPTVTGVGAAGVTPWYYKITTLGGDGESTGSGTGVNVTGNATLSGSNYNQIGWSAVAGASGYNVYRSTDNVNFYLIDSPGTNAYSDTGASAGTQTPPVSNTTMALLDGGALQTPVIVPAEGYVVGFPPGAIVIAD